MTYIPNTKADQRKMLEFIGAENIDELFDTIPQALRLKNPLDIPGPLSEMELMKFASDLSNHNQNMQENACFLGAGIYDHYIPATVPAIIGRSEFYTSYTPYQPEVSQGNLQSIFEFQTLICELTGMEVANASMYDGATALAEAALMASGITGRREWLVSGCIHPAYLETLKTYAWAAGYTLVNAKRSGIGTDLTSVSDQITDKTACVLVQSPNFFGSIESCAQIEKITHAKGALLVMSFDPLSLGLIKPPGEFNADICTAEGQSLGIPMGFGGPLLGLFACKKEFVRHMPGRLVGATTDSDGRRGYTLTLQTREQHIRREKATSNICTNEALCALAATVYLSTLGKSGLKEVSDLCFQKAHYAADRIAELEGCEVLGDRRFFKEFVVKCREPIADIQARLFENKIIGGLDLGRFFPEFEGHMLICVTEKRTREEIDVLVGGLAG